MIGPGSNLLRFQIIIFFHEKRKFYYNNPANVMPESVHSGNTKGLGFFSIL
jgi:hypothetical protein